MHDTYGGREGMKQALLAIALLAGVSSFAIAQTTTQSTTESQIKSQLEKEGYTNINLKRNLSSSTMKS